MTRLSALDATFLHVEDDVTHMHIGSVGLFEGPAPAHEVLMQAIAGRLHRVPRLRQKVRFVPLDAGRPVWVDDAAFDLAYHVRRTAIPPPGSAEELRRLMGRVMARQLDRDRPLWELWAVEGLADGTWALISKMHHAMVDGIAGSNATTALMDLARDAEPEPAPPWRPGREPSDAQLVADALAERARTPVSTVRSLAGAVRHPRAAAGRVATVAHGVAGYAGLVRQGPDTALNGPIGVGRRYAWARASLSDVRVVRHGLGGTVNDVVLTAIAGGFADLLAARGISGVQAVRTLVPVSVRAVDAAGVPDNRVSAIFAELPVGIDDPVARLAAVIEQMRRLKRSHEPEAGEVLTALACAVPELLLDAGGRLATRAPQHSVSTVTTNVPGPQFPLYLAGRRMLESFPYVPLGGHVRIGVAIYSYDGMLGFGVTGDWDTAPDVDVLCDGIERSMAALVARASGGPRRRSDDAELVRGGGDRHGRER